MLIAIQCLIWNGLISCFSHFVLRNEMNWLCPPKIYKLKLYSQCDGIRRWGLWWLSHEGGAPMCGISALLKQAPESSLAPSNMWGDRAWRRPSVDQEAGPHQTTVCRHLNLGLPVSRTVRDCCCSWATQSVVFCQRSSNGLRQENEHVSSNVIRKRCWVMSRFDFLIGITGEGGLVEKKIELRISLRLSWPLI